MCFSSLRKFFTASVYAKLLHNDPYGRISIMQFFNYVMRKGLDLHLAFWSTWSLFACGKVSSSPVYFPGISCHWMSLISAPSPSVAASDPDRSESVRCCRTGPPQGVGKPFHQNHQLQVQVIDKVVLFFSVRRKIMVCSNAEIVWFRILRTTSWSWSPLCLSWMGWRSPSTLSTSARLFASSFSSSTPCEQVRLKRMHSNKWRNVVREGHFGFIRSNICGSVVFLFFRKD